VVLFVSSLKVGCFWQARLDWTSHETLTGSGMAGLSESELSFSGEGNPTLVWPTQARPDVLDLPREIDHAAERFRAKWEPVRVKKTRQNKRLEPGSDPIRTEKALGPGGNAWPL
jgi:hypothetical protein